MAVDEDLHHDLMEVMKSVSVPVSRASQELGACSGSVAKANFCTIICLEQIPPTFKLGSIVPVHKGKGRAHKSTTTTCTRVRIMLTSVLSKCLKVTILEQWKSLFVERGFPHPSQTAYQRGLLCMDTILMDPIAEQALLTDEAGRQFVLPEEPSKCTRKVGFSFFRALAI